MYKPGILTGFIIVCCLGQADPIYSQNVNPYHINGNAYQENCNCYTLTNDEFNQSGSVWNINKINLSQSFSYKFNVNLGCRDIDGADGMAFVLQPISTSIGSIGGGLGFQGISPSIGIAIDTWQNIIDGDPFTDHLSIHRNGDLNHSSINNLAGPVTASNVNIEDCGWHVLHISWDAASKRLSAVIDQKDTVITTIDMVTDVFGGNPEVFWGFTGSTGGSRNRQRFCTSLNPGIAALAGGTVTCFPTPIQFSDSSVSFGDIVKWHWDFGDGTTDTVKTPAPHIFPAPGIYEVKVNIVGNNGCLSDTFKRIVTIGSEPVTKFGYQPSLLCENALVGFHDSSLVQFGTINSRIWNLVGHYTDTTISPSYLTQFGSSGPYEMQLTVQTREGCVSPSISKVFTVFPGPDVTMSVTDACFNEPVNFTASNLDPSVTVSKWYWDLGDGNTASTSVVPHKYADSGHYTVRMVAVSSDGCTSDTISRPVTIYATHAFAGNDTIVAINQPVQLNASGGLIYSWSPATGLNNPGISNPIAILQNDMRYIVTASALMGCESSDTILIKAIKGPAIYVPNAFTPNNDGKNDRFRFVPVGMKEVYYFRIFNRYGQLVYTSNNSQPGWDGTLNGKLQSTGTYVWMVSGKDFNDKLSSLRGTVILVR